MSNKVPQIRFNGYSDPWVQRKLGEVATLSSSKRIHLSDYVTEGIPFYRGSEISTGGITGNQELFISKEKFDEIKEKYGVPSEGDLLVTAVGTLGNLWKVDSRRFYYKDGNLIQISKMQVNSDYLLTYFTGGIGKKRLLDSAAGSNQKALTMVKMREITVDFPSEDEQQKIGSFFKQLDDTIALHQRKLDLLKEQKKGYLQKMFPKNGAKVPELRFAGFADDWEERKLGEVSNIKTGSSDLQDATDNGEYPFFVRSEKIERSHRYLFDGEAILIPGEGRLGEIYHYINGKFDFHQRVYKISNFTNFKVSGMYILYYMQHNFKRHAMKFTVKATVDSLRLPMLTEFDIKIPLEAEQTKIGSFFKQLDDTIALHQRKLDLLKEQKKGFLEKMFV